jgi:hypothetical protein
MGEPRSWIREKVPKIKAPGPENYTPMQKKGGWPCHPLFAVRIANELDPRFNIVRQKAEAVKFEPETGEILGRDRDPEPFQLPYREPKMMSSGPYAVS